MNKVWDDQMTARLRVLWATGMVTRLIGEEIGVTKNAVIGMARRMKLPARAKGHSGTRRKIKPIGIRKDVAFSNVQHYVVPKPKVKRAKINSRPVHITELRRHHCHDVLGGFMYCGAPTVNETVWCQQHYDRYIVQRPLR